MNVHIWNKKTEKWIRRYNVNHIVTSINKDWFKLDGKKYDTETYEINFIHASIIKKTCPLWEKLPNHDCSECSNANEDCIMLG